MVTSEFASKQIDMDLNLIQDDFILDLIVDDKSVEVLGAIEYIYMKKYLWIECIAIPQKHQGLGVGKLLIQRMIQLAKSREKQVLLYSLRDVEQFYRKLGFTSSSSFPEKVK